MRLSDSFTVEAPIQTVWDFLLDVERMSQCVPGVESVEPAGDDTYKGKLKVRVGPIAASFDGIVTITETEPPNRMVAEAEADDKAAASAVKLAFTATLKADGDKTIVSHDTELTLRGRLAQFGAAVMTGTAKKMTAQFADNVRAELER